MKSTLNNKLSPVLFIPHGGGPLPLFKEKGHLTMIDFLKEITPLLGEPSAILLISAHWEEDKVTITGGDKPPLIYDYYNFPEAAYKIEYPAPGSPDLANKIQNILTDAGIGSRIDKERGFDHGMFVPLKIMYPNAMIPCVQLSLVNNLDSEIHLKIGKTLTELRKENVLVIGSRFTFHNMKAIMSPEGFDRNKNKAFEDWLIETCTSTDFSSNERTERLKGWKSAPFAEYCHPREEHLIPLHACAGFSHSVAKLVFEGEIAGIKSSAFLW